MTVRGRVLATLLAAGWCAPVPAEETGTTNVLLEVTGYCNCGTCCNWRRTWFGFGPPVVATGPRAGEPKDVGRTSSGARAGRGTLAADLTRFPYGTRFTIPGYGEAVVRDTGSVLKGNRVDAWFPTHGEAQAWGRRRVTAVCAISQTNEKGK